MFRASLVHQRSCYASGASKTASFVATLARQCPVTPLPTDNPQPCPRTPRTLSPPGRLWKDPILMSVADTLASAIHEHERFATSHTRHVELEVRLGGLSDQPKGVGRRSPPVSSPSIVRERLGFAFVPGVCASLHKYVIDCARIANCGKFSPVTSRFVFASEADPGSRLTFATPTNVDLNSTFHHAKLVQGTRKGLLRAQTFSFPSDPYDVRLSLSTEEDMTGAQSLECMSKCIRTIEAMKLPKHVRYIRRRSLQLGPMFRIDMSKIRTTDKPRGIFFKERWIEIRSLFSLCTEIPDFEIEVNIRAVKEFQRSHAPGHKREALETVAQELLSLVVALESHTQTPGILDPSSPAGALYV